MPPKLFKKADPEIKQYGQPTPANPLDNGNQDDKDNDDLKIKKPSIPGQPGNEPGNQATNGPLIQNGNPIQADMEKEAERTLLPEQPRPKGKTPYEYDPRMQNRTMPIAQPTTRAEGAPSWVTGSRRPKLLNKDAEMSVPDKHEFRIAVQTLKAPDAMLGVMGGPSKEQALQTLARHGYRWDDADYMRGGKGLKRAAVKVADDYGTVEDLRRFLDNFDHDAKVRFVSAASTYPQIELPIYETWNNGGVPTISLDTDLFYNHIEKINKELAARRNPKPATPAVPAPQTAGLRRRRDYGEKTAIQTPQVDAIPGMTPLGLPDPKVEARNRRKANAELASLGQRYHSSMPLQEIRDILQKYGFNPEAMDGIYTGEEGKMHEQAGPKTWISMTWHKMPRTGTWEIVAYLS